MQLETQAAVALPLIVAFPTRRGTAVHPESQSGRYYSTSLEILVFWPSIASAW